MASINIGDKYINKQVKEKAYEEKPYKKLDNKTAKMMAETMKADIPPEQEEAVQKQVMVKSTAANTQPTAREQMARDIASQNKSEPEQQQQQQKQPAPEQREQVREGLSQGFKDALLYFGPRLGAMILGGSEAAELTDEALQGWEAHQAGLQNRRLKERDMALREKGDKEEDPRLAYKKERDQLMDQRYAEQQEQAIQKQREEKKSEIDTLNEQISRMTKAESYLSDENVVGPVGGTVGKYTDKLGLAGERGSRRQAARKFLQELRVDEGLKKSQQLKGAINQKEFETLFSGVPDLSDDNPVWKTWFSERKAILNKALKKMGAGSSQQFSAGQTVRSKTTGKMYRIMPDGSKQEIK